MHVSELMVLGFENEVEYPLRPMGSLLEATGVTDAMELFEYEVQCVDPAFRLKRSNRTFVYEACQILEGVPLSLRLAARSSRERAHQPAVH